MDIAHLIILFILVTILVASTGLLLMRRRLTDREVSLDDHYAIVPAGKRLVLGGFQARDLVVIHYSDTDQAEVKTVCTERTIGLKLDQPVGVEVYDAFEIHLTKTTAGLCVTWTSGLNAV